MSYTVNPAPINEPIDKNTGIFSGVWKMWYEKVYRAFVDIATRLAALEAAYYPSVQTSYASPARDIGTVYQNTTGRPMWVRVWGTKAAGSFTIKGFTDANNPPTTEKDVMDHSAGFTGTVGFWVLPNHYYKTTLTAVATQQGWVESY